MSDNAIGLLKDVNFALENSYWMMLLEKAGPTFDELMCNACQPSRSENPSPYCTPERPEKTLA